MVRQVLSFARGEEAHRADLEVAELITLVEEFCRDALPKSIRLDIDVPESLWLITADKTQLFQVLVNLVTNAREAMPEGGVLTIHARNVEDGPPRHVAIEVEDNGYGMDAATKSRIFEPFFTTGKAGHGTGLGLSTSSTIIRNHDGELDVYSEPGQGTRFRIRLPATLREGSREVVAPAAADLLPRGNGERILVVDDEATIRSIACQALEANGYQTVAAANGVEAVAIMERGEVTVDLLFTDMMMPEMDGAATAAYFLNNFPRIAVIATSRTQRERRGGSCRPFGSEEVRFEAVHHHGAPNRRAGDPGYLGAEVVTEPTPALRVVVADDDPFTVSLVAGGLEAQGFEVTTASSIGEAWDAVEREDPHALITDLDFGDGLSGATLLGRVHHDYPWVGLVVLTSHRSPELAVANPLSIPETCVYLVKSSLSQVSELADAVHQSIAGLPAEEAQPELGDDTVTVTQAQADVLRRLAHGASTRALAEHRGTTVRAVELMLARLFTALGVDGDEQTNPRVEAVSLWHQGRISVR